MLKVVMLVWALKGSDSDSLNTSLMRFESPTAIRDCRRVANNMTLNARVIDPLAQVSYDCIENLTVQHIGFERLFFRRSSALHYGYPPGRN